MIASAAWVALSLLRSNRLLLAKTGVPLPGSAVNAGSIAALVCMERYGPAPMYMPWNVPSSCPDQVEVVMRRIELADVRQNLKQTERQHDGAVPPLLVHHVDGDIAAAVDAAQADVPGIEGPVLSVNGRHNTIQHATFRMTDPLSSFEK